MNLEHILIWTGLMLTDAGLILAIMYTIELKKMLLDDGSGC